MRDQRQQRNEAIRVASPKPEGCTARAPVGDNGWKSVRLGDLFRIKHGYAFKGEHFSESGPYVVLTPGNFYEEGGFKHKGDKEKYYTGEFPPGFILSRGDLIVAMTEQSEGLLGSPALIPKSDRYLHNQRLGLIIELNETEIDKGFLYYLFNYRSVRNQIQATASGAKVRHTSPSRIYEVEATLPPLLTQRKIAAVLSAYDDLIENNLRRIEILEEMARAIYREWFVHFRFPGHEKVKMVDSELGPLPEGWEVRKVSEVAKVYRGRSYKSANLVEEGGLPFLNLKCIERDGGFRRDGVKRYSGPYKETQTAKPGDTIVAVTDMTQERRIVARAARVPNTAGQNAFVFSMDLVKLLPNDGVPSEYFYGMLRFSGFADHVKQYANGANVLHLSPSRIEEFKFALPTSGLRAQYADLCADLHGQYDILSIKNDNLRRARDLLLPKLISGEVDVSELDIGDESNGF